MNQPLDDDLLRHLTQLTPIEPEALATESVRAQCRAALARRGRRRTSRRGHLEFAIVSLAAVVYLAAVVHQALYGLP